MWEYARNDVSPYKIWSVTNFGESNRLNNFAESNNDVVEGLKRSAAAMAAMNQSFEDTAALFTGGMEILQDAESMGTALRTLSMRVRGKLSSLPPYTVMYMLCP